MKSITLIVVICILTLSQSCHKKPVNPTYCTLEYRTISIEVIGDTLDDFYTIRQNTGDTIRLSNNYTIGNSYPILVDNYQQQIENKTETFQFYGLIHDSIVIHEPFVIKADQCHIEYVSGNLQVTL